MDQEQPLGTTPEGQRKGGRRLAAMRYPDAYVWLVLVSAMDLMLTWLILELGGKEVNPLADWVLHTGGFFAMVVYKFVAVLVAIGACEVLGRLRPISGRRLAWAAVIISAIPIVVALWQLLTVRWG